MGIAGDTTVFQPDCPEVGDREVPVGDGRVGAIVIGGLNPVAILEESGYRVHSRAMAGLVDFTRLFPHQELEARVRKML